VTPGEVVERKRVADMMVQIQVAQQDPVRVREAAARLALREAPAVSLKPDRYPCRRVDPPASILEVVPMDRGEATTVEEGYAVRWIRKRPFLYKRAISTKPRQTGGLPSRTRSLGPWRRTLPENGNGRVTLQLPLPSPRPWPYRRVRSGQQQRRRWRKMTSAGMRRGRHPRENLVARAPP
jgi:hypothetical protein